MDSVRVGRSLRALRIRRRWRQADLGAHAGISAAQCSRIERGDLRGVRLAHVEAVCTALGADLDVRVRWHGEGLDRLLDAGHAALVNGVVRQLERSNWESSVEVSFSEYGERGSIDVLAWHAASRALLVIEVKSVVPDIQATIATLDRKARLGPAIARRRGWQATVVGALLVVAESSTSRQRVAMHAELFNRAYPDRAYAVRRWLRDPSGRLAGLIFLRNGLPDRAMNRTSDRQRVRRRQTGANVPYDRGARDDSGSRAGRSRLASTRRLARRLRFIRASGREIRNVGAARAGAAHAPRRAAHRAPGAGRARAVLACLEEHARGPRGRLTPRTSCATLRRLRRAVRIRTHPEHAARVVGFRRRDREGSTINPRG